MLRACIVVLAHVAPALGSSAPVEIEAAPAQVVTKSASTRHRLQSIEPIIQEADFACGEDVDKYCGPPLPRDEVNTCLQQHRTQLGFICHAHLVEQEAFKCGIAIEILCGDARKNGTIPFRQCILGHGTELLQICPEKENFLEYDERENVVCGIEFDAYCKATCGTVTPDCINCINNLETKSTACLTAFLERDDFECGVDVGYYCGKARALGPYEFVHCIVEQNLCQFKI